MSVASGELRFVQIPPVFTTHNLGVAPKYPSVPSISSRRGVKRRLFGGPSGDEINQMLHENNVTNAAHLLNKYHFDARAVATEEAKNESTESARHRKLVQQNEVAMPSLIDSELLAYQKRLVEEQPNMSRIPSTEVTPAPAPVHSRKCNVSTKCSNGNCQTHCKQSLVTDCFQVRKSTQQNDGRLVVLAQSLCSSFPKSTTMAEAAVCNILDGTTFVEDTPPSTNKQASFPSKSS